MKVSEIIQIIEQKIAPPELALHTDSIGLMTGSPEAEVSSVFVCLDLTEQLLSEAAALGCALIITHHPLMFTPAARLTECDVRGRLLCSAVRKQMNVYSAHTNLDFAVHGVNDSLAEKLGLQSIRKDRSQEHSFGLLPASLPYEDFIVYTAEKLETKGIRFVLPNACGALLVRRVGVSCGAYDHETDWIYENHVDALVTGEVKHSDAVSLSMERFLTVAGGHYATEIWGVEKLAARLDSYLKAHQIPVLRSALEHDPLCPL